MKVYISYMMYLMTVFVQWIEEKMYFCKCYNVHELSQSY